MKKKLLTLVLVVALAVTTIVGGTLAYQVDTEDAVNVAVVGMVDVELIEQQRGENGLEPFEDFKVLMPIVGAAQGAKDDYGMPVAANYADKIVRVENTGDQPAWIRVIVAIPAALEGSSADQNALHWNLGNRFDPKGGKAYNDGAWDVAGNPYFDDFGNPGYELVENVVIDGMEYNLYTFTTAAPVQADDTTAAVMSGFYLDSGVDYDDETGKWVLLDDKSNKIGEIDYDLSKPVQIPVFVQAVQAAGFETAKEAFAASFGGDITENNHPWAGEALPKLPTFVETEDGLLEALENGESVRMTDDVEIEDADQSNGYGTTGISVKNGQTVDGGGNVLDVGGANGTWDSAISTTGGTIKNITVTGAFRGIFVNHNSSHSERVILENVVIDDTVYTISCDQGNNQGLTAINSTFNGWTSYAATLGDAEFIDCIFGEGSGYAFMRPYAPTSFVGCEFEAGYEMDPRAAVTFENCTLDGVLITEDNLSTLVTSRIENASVK